MTKRTLDVAVSLVTLALCAPLMAVVALAVRLLDGPPVLFRQVRPGLGEKPFELLKFRTMRSAFDREGREMLDQARITPLGAVLRRSSLDELPQLWNVLRGDMSLVGPRPLLMQYLPLYTPEQARRHEVRPGLTGLAQVRGRNAMSWRKKFELDVWYVDHQSLILDLTILLLTVRAVVTRSGVSQPGEATVRYFEGNAAADN